VASAGSLRSLDAWAYRQLSACVPPAYVAAPSAAAAGN
jgi:hypothetical protein